MSSRVASIDLLPLYHVDHSDVSAVENDCSNNLLLYTDSIYVTRQHRGAVAQRVHPVRLMNAGGCQTKPTDLDQEPTWLAADVNDHHLHLLHSA